MVKKASFEYLSQDYLLKGYTWDIEAKTKKGIVLLVHGMAEHISRYDIFAKFLATNGYLVYGFDQRGHGQSAITEEDIGYMSDIDNFKVLVSDVYQIINMIKSENDNLPIYILGHSMGSFVTQRYIEEYGNTIDGVILSGSTLNKGLEISFGYTLSKMIILLKGRKHRSKIMHKLSFEAFNKKFVPNRTPVDWLTKNENIVDAYINDELCGNIFTISFYKDLFKGFNNIYKNIELIPNNLPIYIFSGEQDPVGGQGKNVRKLYETLQDIGVKDIELKLYPEGRHEMLNEINKEDVFHDVLEWLNKKTTSV